MLENLEFILQNKDVKTKEKTEKLSELILSKSLDLEHLIDYANKSKDPIKATCIEAIEFATKKNPQISNLNCLNYISSCLSEKAPRVKWESAKIIGNIAHLYPEKLELAIKNLLTNSEHSGTVVRWSAAFALGEIIKIKTSHNKELIPAIESICLREEKNSIKKIYLSALKKVVGN